MEQLNDVLMFWFGSSGDDADVAASRSSFWFGKSDATDRQIERDFGHLVRLAGSGGLNHLIDSPRSRLAVIILLDQFTRNIHRGKPECFADDPLALQLALEGVERGEDRQLRPVERVFFYLPLEHAEDLGMQERSVELFRQIVEDAPANCRKIFTTHYDYAVRHRDIIARFGRYPHRNQILGRESTPEEAEFLTQPGSSF